MGRRTVGSRASPVWRAFFAVFAPLKRLAGPAFRILLRICGSALGVLDVSPDNGGDVGTNAVAVTNAASSGMQASELDTVLPDYVGYLPVSAARSPCSCRVWVADEGPWAEMAFAPVGALSENGRRGSGRVRGYGGAGARAGRYIEPVGVLAGMTLAAVRKAARGTRARWLESPGWDRVARVLKGRHATSPGREDASEHGAPHLGPVVSADALKGPHGRLPLRPNGRTRAWGVHTFARLRCAVASFLETSRILRGTVCRP